MLVGQIAWTSVELALALAASLLCRLLWYRINHKSFGVSTISKTQ